MENDELKWYFLQLRTNRGLSRKAVAEMVAPELGRKVSTVFDYLHTIECYPESMFRRGTKKPTVQFLRVLSQKYALTMEERAAGAALLRQGTYLNGVVDALGGELPESFPPSVLPDRAYETMRKLYALPEPLRHSLERLIDEQYRETTAPVEKA